jgi:hypothetical protein
MAWNILVVNILYRFFEELSQVFRGKLDDLAELKRRNALPYDFVLNCLTNDTRDNRV